MWHTGYDNKVSGVILFSSKLQQYGTDSKCPAIVQPGQPSIATWKMNVVEFCKLIFVKTSLKSVLFKKATNDRNENFGAK